MALAPNTLLMSGPMSRRDRSLVLDTPGRYRPTELLTECPLGTALVSLLIDLVLPGPLASVLLQLLMCLHFAFLLDIIAMSPDVICYDVSRGVASGSVPDRYYLAITVDARQQHGTDKPC